MAKLSLNETRMSRNLHRSKTVLLVEDLDMLRKMVRDFMESLGIEVLEASNSAKAIDNARCHPGTIDLLLTDVEMPGTSGWASANQIAVLRPGIPIIYMSAGATLEEWNEYREKSVRTHFIQKPFRLEELRELLMTIFSE